MIALDEPEDTIQVSVVLTENINHSKYDTPTLLQRYIFGETPADLTQIRNELMRRGIEPANVSLAVHELLKTFIK